MKNCYKCRLCQTRIEFVYGEGSLNPNIMFIGEAPGAEENVTGRPFVGKAGQLLRKLLTDIGIDNFYITNIVKCRPPNNRDPRQDEFDACKEYLFKQMNVVKPKIIILLEKIAAKFLLKTNESVGKMRKKTYQLDYFKTYVTYHPAAALYENSYLKYIKEDLIKIKESI